MIPWVPFIAVKQVRGRNVLKSNNLKKSGYGHPLLIIPHYYIQHVACIEIIFTSDKDYQCMTMHDSLTKYV